jgi:hypothetical protein
LGKLLLFYYWLNLAINKLLDTLQNPPKKPCLEESKVNKESWGELLESTEGNGEVHSVRWLQ